MDGGESERLRNERQGRVVVFSAVDGVGNRRAVEGLPAGAGLEGERAIDAKLSDACGLALPGLSVPAIAESDFDLVAASVEQLGNVISCVENALVIVCEAGVENVIADALAVDAELIIADAGDVGARVARRAFERECVFENAAAGDLLALPVGAGEESCLEVGDGGRSGGFVVLVPKLDSP